MIRQLLTEATLLFFCGGTLGLLVARWAQGLITQFATGIVPSGTYLQIDTKVFAIGLGLCFVSALLFGLIPAISSTRVGLNNFLKGVSLERGGWGALPSISESAGCDPTCYGYGAACGFWTSFPKSDACGNGRPGIRPV